MKISFRKFYLTFTLLTVISINFYAQGKKSDSLPENPTINEINVFVKSLLPKGSKFKHKLTYYDNDKKKNEEVEVSYKTDLIKFEDCKLSIAFSKRSKSSFFSFDERAEINLGLLANSKFTIIDEGDFFTVLLRSRGARDILIRRTFENKNEMRDLPNMHPNSNSIESRTVENKTLSSRFSFALSKKDNAIEIVNALEKATVLCQKSR
jgi:hypothetical protein